MTAQDIFHLVDAFKHIRTLDDHVDAIRGCLDRAVPVAPLWARPALVQARAEFGLLRDEIRRLEQRLENAQRVIADTPLDLTNGGDHCG